ncbi:hypothetical protein E2C01_012347 [Portunus trituberculatus]|uniref:Uncharacterized protein n=1 Tax=Portunus trituberculatus TaxID=210409 RepID=A0A5B7DDT7_PORTR|nr:hypothetical protein [Portunus trituberculatus]
MAALLGDTRPSVTGGPPKASSAEVEVDCTLRRHWALSSPHLLLLHTPIVVNKSPNERIQSSVCIRVGGKEVSAEGMRMRSPKSVNTFLPA